MTSHVWKYELEIKDEQTIALPSLAKVLCVQEQKGKLCLWAIVNADVRDTAPGRTFCIVGTGHPMSVDALRLTYISTVQMHSGALVWHVFEKKM